MFKANNDTRAFRAIQIFLVMIPIFAGCRKAPERTADPTEGIIIACAAIPHASLVQIALTKGYFTDEGLKVVVQRHAFGKPALDSVLQGQADLATVAETPVMFAILNGKDICISAVVETSDSNNAIIARKEPGIRSPKDLKGKLIGVAKGSNGEFVLDSFLVAQGMERSDVGITNMTPDQMMEGLLTRKIAAAAVWNPTLILCKKALGENGEIFYVKELYTESFCLASSRAFTQKRPGALRKVIKALLRAEFFANEHPEAAIALVADFINTDKKAVQEVWHCYRFKVTLDQSLLVMLEDTCRWAIKNRLVESKTMPNYRDFIYADALLSVQPDRVRLIR